MPNSSKTGRKFFFGPVHNKSLPITSRDKPQAEENPQRTQQNCGSIQVNLKAEPTALPHLQNCKHKWRNMEKYAPWILPSLDTDASKEEVWSGRTCTVACSPVRAPHAALLKFFSHHYLLFFSRKSREFDKKQLHGKQCSWDITTQCQQAWHNPPGVSVFLISKKHPLIPYPQLKLPMRRDTPDLDLFSSQGK